MIHILIFIVYNINNKYIYNINIYTYILNLIYYLENLYLKSTFLETKLYIKKFYSTHAIIFYCMCIVIYIVNIYLDQD